MGNFRASSKARLLDLEISGRPHEVLEFFDGLPAASLDSMIGAWQGKELATGHAFDGLLGPAGWHGKVFRSADEVVPLVFRDRKGRLFAGDPAWMPLAMLHRFPKLARHPVASALFRTVAPLLATAKPCARLRMTEFRGVVSATMIYDALPIHDIFRTVDDDTVVGAMDIRGFQDPFFFSLRRENAD